MVPRRIRSTIALGVVVAAGALVGCSSDPGSTSAFCDQVREVPALESVLARFSETEPAVLQDRIDKARAAYDELADAAPSSIRADAREIVALVDEILTAVEEHPDDPEKAAAQLRAAMDEHPKVAEARTAVATFAQDECDVQLDPALAESPTDTSTTVGSTGPTSEAGSSTTTTGPTDDETSSTSTVPTTATG